ncbi:MAG: TetR/AcrR family transcriptional regulator [Chitinophagaceae bacterium]
MEQPQENTEQKILSAARQVFIEKGLSGARMQDIADKAGINKALLHYYFRSKDKLFETVFQEAATKFLPRISVLFQPDIPLFEKIRLFVETYIDLLIENPFIPLFILNEVQKNPQDHIMKLWGGELPPVKEFHKQIEAEVKAGIIKPVHPFDLMLNMISMCVFPFVGTTMIKAVFSLSNEQFMEGMQQRKHSVSTFIIDSIKL